MENRLIKSPIFIYVLLATWLLSTMSLWAFAFLPSEQTSPEWLLASRNACFGTLNSGLPNAGGWVLLIASPLTFLLVLLSIWYRDIKKSLKLLFSSTWGRLVFSLFLFSFLLESSIISKKIQAGLNIEATTFSSTLEGDLPSHYPRTFKKAYVFKHINQYGEEITLDNLLKNHKTVTLSFSFAQCRTICPMLLRKIKKTALSTKNDESVFVIITLDPWRDTAFSIKSWAKEQELPENIHILTDSVESIQKTLKAYAVPNSRNMKTGDIDHPPLTYIIDSNIKIAYTLGNVPPDWIMQAIKRSYQ